MRKLITCTVAVLMSTSVLAAGEIYRWKDANGTWHYSDQPQAGAELVRSTRAAAAAPAPLPPAEVPPAQSVVTTEPPPVSDGVAREVRQQAESIRAEQCKQAEDSYQEVLRARRIYKLDEQGNRTFLSEAELDAQRLQARSNRDLACRN